MTGNRDATLYIGNLDERVSDKVLYEILIQAGRVVDLHIPRDKDSNRHKGYAFAEYETEDSANYAVKLFSGLVTIYNRTLKFAISGQDKAAQNVPTPNLTKPRPLPVQVNNNETSQYQGRFSPYPSPPTYAHQEPPPPGIVQNNGHIPDHNGRNSYNHRSLGSWDSNERSHSSRKLYASPNPLYAPPNPLYTSPKPLYTSPKPLYASHNPLYASQYPLTPPSFLPF